MSATDPLSIFFDRYERMDNFTGRYPHWRQQGKLYFVTWRLADSLPQHQLDELQRARNLFTAEFGGMPLNELSQIQRARFNKLYNERVQRWLDAGAGSCELNDVRARCIVRDALRHFDGQRYKLGSFAIAGNHVHVLVIPFVGHTLSQILHSWKSFTAHAINKALGRTGTFWRHEYYDHIVRDEEALDGISTYIHAHVDQGAYVEKNRLS